MSENLKKRLEKIKITDKFIYIVLQCPKCNRRGLEEITGMGIWRCKYCAYVIEQEKLTNQPRKYKHRIIKTGINVLEEENEN